MVEFFVIAGFGVLGVIAIWPYLRIDPSDGVTSLPEAIRDNYQSYAYVISLSEYPDDYSSDPLAGPLADAGIDLVELEELSSALAAENPADALGDLAEARGQELLEDALGDLNPIDDIDLGDFLP